MNKLNLQYVNKYLLQSLVWPAYTCFRLVWLIEQNDYEQGSKKHEVKYRIFSKRKLKYPFPPPRQFYKYFNLINRRSRNKAEVFALDGKPSAFYF